MVVMAHSTITAGKPLRPVNALIICCSAESSATIYKNKVMSLKKNVSIEQSSHCDDDAERALRQQTQVQGGNHAIPLPSPLGQDEALGTFRPDDWPKKTEHEEW